MLYLKSNTINLSTCALLILITWSRVVYSVADEDDVWQISVSDSIIHDDNLFRLSHAPIFSVLLPSGASRSDTINRATLAGFLNFELSRQNIILKAQIDSNQYFKNSKLDHISTDDQVLWKWRAGKYIFGDIGYNYRVYQSSFTNSAILGKDLITENTAFAIGQFALDPNWRIRGGVNWTEAKHDVKARNFLNRQSNGFFGGFRLY